MPIVTISFKQTKTQFFMSKHLHMDHQLQDSKRTKLRTLLFSEHHEYSKAKFDEQTYFQSHWSDYMNCNFEHESPGPAQAVAELKKMIKNMHTPRTRNIPARKLSNLELAILQKTPSYLQGTPPKQVTGTKYNPSQSEEHRKL